MHDDLPDGSACAEAGQGTGDVAKSDSPGDQGVNRSRGVETPKLNVDALEDGRLFFVSE